MSGSMLPLNPTGPLADSAFGFDPLPVINAGEQQLADFLSTPSHRILQELGLGAPPTATPTAPPNPGPPAHGGSPITPVDPTMLISPVVNALGTLGTGQFSGLDPTSMFSGIANAFDNTSGPLQQALSAVQQGWQGASNTAAAAKTGAALANGSEVAAQATELQNSLSTAAADVAQAQAQLIAIINEFLATLAAIGPNIIFPWGWAAVAAAAARAVTQAAQVITEVQGSLAAQAGAVSAIGAPVNVTAAPALGSMLGPVGSLLGLGSTSSTMSPTTAMSTLAPLMSAASPLIGIATAGISPALSAATMAANPAAAGAATGTLAGATDTDPKSAAHGAAPDPKSAILAGSGSGGGTGGAAPSGVPVSRVTAPITPAAQTTMAVPATGIRPATGGVPITGPGMMGAPLAGAGQPGGTSGAHSAASFLHTTDQGGKVVGAKSTVAPPVIGEVDPNETPDIELRI